MLKERYGNFIPMWIVSTILLFLSISIIIIHPTICINNMILWLLVALVIGTIFIGGFVGFIVFSEAIIFITIMDHIDKKSYLKSLEEIKNLSNEFSEVILKNNNETPLSKFIPNKEIKCIAKLDDDGNIIYKIHVDIEASTTDYEAFLKEFNI